MLEPDSHYLALGSPGRHPGPLCCPWSAGTITEPTSHCEELFKNECVEYFLIHIHYPLTCSQRISQKDAKLITTGYAVWK